MNTIPSQADAVRERRASASEGSDAKHRQGVAQHLRPRWRRRRRSSTDEPLTTPSLALRIGNLLSTQRRHGTTTTAGAPRLTGVHVIGSERATARRNGRRRPARRNPRKPVLPPKAATRPLLQPRAPRSIASRGVAPYPLISRSPGERRSAATAPRSNRRGRVTAAIQAAKRLASTPQPSRAQRPTSSSLFLAFCAANTKAPYRLSRSFEASANRTSKSQAATARHADVTGDMRAQLEPGDPSAVLHTTRGPAARPVALALHFPSSPRMSASSSSAAAHHASAASSRASTVADPGPARTIPSYRAAPEFGKHPSGRVAGTAVGATIVRTRSARGCARSHRRTPTCGLVPASSSTATRCTNCDTQFLTTKKSVVRPQHVCSLGAFTVPPTSSSQPDCRNWSGVMFQSAPTIHGPSSKAKTCASACSKSRLRADSPSVTHRYKDTTCKPPRQTFPTH
jgi:hypothetical protein